MKGRGRIVGLLTAAIGIVVVLIAEGHPGGGRGGGARHPRSGADGSDGKDRSVAPCDLTSRGGDHRAVELRARGP